MLFLHGWGCNHTIFNNVVTLLPNLCCHLVDFPGFGDAKNPDESGWTVKDYADDLATYMQQNCLSGVVVVAHSFGCRVAMALASCRPHLVSKMLFVSPAGLRFFSVKRWLKEKHYKLRRLFGRQKQLSAMGSADYRFCPQRLKNTFVKVVNQDLSPYAKKVRCPVLVINGKADKATPLSHAKKLCKLLPNGTLIPIEGDHFALFFQPKVFAKIVNLFVNPTLCEDKKC